MALQRSSKSTGARSRSTSRTFADEQLRQFQEGKTKSKQIAKHTGGTGATVPHAPKPSSWTQTEQRFQIGKPGTKRTQPPDASDKQVRDNLVSSRQQAPDGRTMKASGLQRRKSAHSGVVRGNQAGTT